jgi:ribosomal protein S18 acetylase RimI-like enzyme
MASDAVIRSAVAADGPAIRALTERAYAPYVTRIGRRPAPMDADDAELIAAGTVWLLEEAGRVRGALVCELHPDHLLIENVAVDPYAKGRGLGRRLLDYAEVAARALGRREIRLYTNARMTENRAIYRHLGYEETGQRTDAGFERVYFRKRL